jgi:hypothetical protein
MTRHLATTARSSAARAADAALWAAVVTGARARRALDTAVRRSLERGDRGDVPGWVLVTLMTAGLVTALWVLARDRLTAVFDRAISSVTGQ